MSKDPYLGPVDNFKLPSKYCTGDKFLTFPRSRQVVAQKVFRKRLATLGNAWQRLAFLVIPYLDSAEAFSIT